MGNRTARWLLRAAVLLLYSISLTVAATPEEKPVKELEVFVRAGCPHCAEAKQFLRGFAGQRPQLRIVYRSLDSDPRAAEDLARHSRRAGAWPPGVPTFVIDGRVLVGFASPEETGPRLAALVDGGTDPPGKTETRGPAGLRVEKIGLPLFTITLGLIDGFNPCAMWVLLFLLSILVRLRDRRRMALIAGTFVLASGLVYYAFMAAWLNLFLLVGLSDLLRWLLATVALVLGAINLLDALHYRGTYTLAIPEAARPRLYRRARDVLRANRLLSSVLGVVVLAVLVNFIELLCTAGLPALYTAVLAQQALGGPAYYAYLGLYILAYIADDALMVTIAVVALGSHRLSVTGARSLKLLSGLVMVGLGGIMLLLPQFLM